MQVREIMSREILLINPDRSIKEAAKLMASGDTGVLPVSENDRLVGVITDRDIAVRAVADGRSPDTPVRQAMSHQKVLYCYEDDDAERVAKNMGENQVRRLPVLNREKRLVGIVSIGDLARAVQPHTAGETIASISRPNGARTPSAH